eukprot:TRINITY_DN2169_c0_g1_i1.p1 TRINITY_DN2169_c0_g1~~TRINITY_DN2169_c0_g1_i1.p1  ORF type:complete len:362 (-),score=53.49 TRINITY_DN2169_c0_g1_i1:67-1110(-)
MEAATFNKLVVHTLGNDFRSATRVESVPIPTDPPAPKHVRVRVHYAGVNASDINFTNGKYAPGTKPPFDCGFEAVAQVIAVGEGATLAVGQPVVIVMPGSYAEYRDVPEAVATPVPALRAEILPLPVSGLTASLGLEHARMTTKETILVTAAAGGTGQFAVQLAKIAGNHVIGTCSTDEKVAFLKKIGCDRVINYKQEDLGSVLKKEYPNGVDIVYESVGGETYETCLDNLAVKGRLVVIGAISGYKDGSSFTQSTPDVTPLSIRLLRKSATVSGFFLSHFASDWKAHMGRLVGLIAEGKLVSGVDPTEFRGLASAADAVEHLFSGKNIGKVVVTIYDGEALPLPTK